MSPGQNYCGPKLLHLPDSSHDWRLLLSTASCHELRRCGSSRCSRLAASSNHCTCNGDLRACSAIEEIPGRSISPPQTILLSTAGGLKEAHSKEVSRRRSTDVWMDWRSRARYKSKYRPQWSFTIKTSERGFPSTPVPSCPSQFEVNKKKCPSLET